MNVIEVAELDPGVRTITLQQPEKRNPLTAELVDELHDALGSLARDNDVRAVILTGAGSAFCSGLDLTGYGTPAGSPEREGKAHRRMRVQQHIADLADSFRRVRAPIIAAVNGPATGGGMALALLCDLRVASTDARFNAAMIRIGLSGCDIGISWLLPRIVGFTRAFEIEVTGRFVDAAEAHAIGLVTSVHPGYELLPAAQELARSIARNNPFGVWMTKEVMWSNLEVSSFRAAIDLENRTQILTTFTEDHREAFTAFRERRDPDYQSR